MFVCGFRNGNFQLSELNQHLVFFKCYIYAKRGWRGRGKDFVWYNILPSFCILIAELNSSYRMHNFQTELHLETKPPLTFVISVCNVVKIAVLYWIKSDDNKLTVQYVQNPFRPITLMLITVVWFEWNFSWFFSPLIYQDSVICAKIMRLGQRLNSQLSSFQNPRSVSQNWNIYSYFQYDAIYVACICCDLGWMSRSQLPHKNTLRLINLLFVVWCRWNMAWYNRPSCSVLKIFYFGKESRLFVQFKCINVYVYYPHAFSRLHNLYTWYWNSVFYSLIILSSQVVLLP